MSTITHESSLENFTEQFDFAIENYVNHGLKVNDFSQIILGGLGGSGISGTIAQNWFSDKCSIPIESIGDYHLPKYACRNTLVILNSYSGNTEETISLFKEAVALDCKILVVTGGGQLKELAEAQNTYLLPIKLGYQPRMTIGIGLSYSSLIIGELLGLDLTPEIVSIRNKFSDNVDRQKESGKRIFDFFSNSTSKKFVIVADKEYAPVATRFVQQLAENSKLEGFVNVLPEANHNIIESYIDRLDTNFIMLYSTVNPRVTARFDFLISHLELSNNKVLPLQIPEYTLHSIFDMIYRLDWVSVFLANELGSRLMEVPIIENLKQFLSEVED